MNSSSACASSLVAWACWGITYCGMYAGPGGAFGLWTGSVASQASNAGRYPGRRRFRASCSARLLPATNAVNQALNDTESSVSVWSASRSARLALVLSADALASDTDDSVLHFAAANPE